MSTVVLQIISRNNPLTNLSLNISRTLILFIFCILFFTYIIIKSTPLVAVLFTKIFLFILNYTYSHTLLLSGCAYTSTMMYYAMYILCSSIVLTQSPTLRVCCVNNSRITFWFFKYWFPLPILYLFQNFKFNNRLLLILYK